MEGFFRTLPTGGEKGHQVLGDEFIVFASPTRVGWKKGGWTLQTDTPSQTLDYTLHMFGYLVISIFR